MLPTAPHRVLRFSGFSPSDDKFTCIYLIRDKGAQRRCSRKVLTNLVQKKEALKLRETIDSSPQHSDTSQNFQDYLKFCLCPRSHQGKFKEIVGEVCAQWQRELLGGEKVAEELIASTEKEPFSGADSLVACKTAYEKSAFFAEDVAFEKLATRDGEDKAGHASHEEITQATKQSNGSAGRGKSKSSNSVPSQSEEPKASEESKSANKTQGVTHLGVSEVTRHPITSDLHRVLNRQLTIGLQKPGYIYMFSCDNYPDMFKIGLASDVIARQGYLQCRCRYRVIPQYETTKIPHAWQVERLVATELRGFRRKIPCNCKRTRKSSRKSTHGEWFTIGADPAITVIYSWAKWMFEARPYDDKYSLKQEWVDVLQEALEAKTQPTGEFMLGKWASMKKTKPDVTFTPYPEPEELQDEEPTLVDSGLETPRAKEPPFLPEDTADDTLVDGIAAEISTPTKASNASERPAPGVVTPIVNRKLSPHVSKPLANGLEIRNGKAALESAAAQLMMITTQAAITMPAGSPFHVKVAVGDVVVEFSTSPAPQLPAPCVLTPAAVVSC